MGRLFAGTPWDRPPSCDRCGKPESECQCPAPAVEPTRIAPEKQTAGLKVEKRPKGKLVTVVKNLDPKGNDLEALAGKLKSRCGSGGTVKDGVIEIQGDHLAAVEAMLAGARLQDCAADDSTGTNHGILAGRGNPGLAGMERNPGRVRASVPGRRFDRCPDVNDRGIVARRSSIRNRHARGVFGDRRGFPGGPDRRPPGGWLFARPGLDGVGALALPGRGDRTWVVVGPIASAAGGLNERRWGDSSC